MMRETFRMATRMKRAMEVWKRNTVIELMVICFATSVLFTIVTFYYFPAVFQAMAKRSAFSTPLLTPLLNGTIQNGVSGLNQILEANHGILQLVALLVAVLTLLKGTIRTRKPNENE
jgi:Zn-dependent membrane protease YugP